MNYTFLHNSILFDIEDSYFYAEENDKLLFMISFKYIGCIYDVDDVYAFTKIDYFITLMWCFLKLD